MPDETLPTEPESSQTPGAETPQEGGDLRIDVRGMIKQASTRVRVDQLVKRGTKYLSLLSKSKIDELINQAVKTIVAKYRITGAAGVSTESIEGEAKQEFNELLNQYQETAKAKNQLETSKSALDQELEEMRKELELQKHLADGKLIEEAEHSLVIGFKEFERELEKIVVRVFERRKLILGNENDPEAIKELDQIKAKLQKIISELVAKERERFRVSGGQSREIAMLEKRIEKLYEQIAAMQNALTTISNSKLFSNQQIQNLLRQLGLIVDDKYYEKKKEMMKIVLQQNLELKKKFKEMEAAEAGQGAQAPPAPEPQSVDTKASA